MSGILNIPALWVNISALCQFYERPRGFRNILSLLLGADMSTGAQVSLAGAHFNFISAFCEFTGGILDLRALF